MSFAFMPVYTGDYLRDTRHLSPLKHGIYLLALMHCWDQKGPLPLDEQECAGICNCRSSDEIEALRYILAKYFTRMDDGLYNHRMQREIERAANISQERSEAGKKGYQAKAKQLLSKSQASASTPTPTPIPPLQPPPEKTKAPGKRSPLVFPDWLNPDDWASFVEHRQRIRKPMTGKSQQLNLEQLCKLRESGFDPASIIQQTIRQGWQGFYPIKSDGKGGKTDNVEEARRLLGFATDGERNA